MLRSHEILHPANDKRQILIADDEPLNRELLELILGQDYELLFAGDGEETLALIRRRRETLSMVLLDLMMPGMNGLELLRIKRDEPDIQQIPVIVVTADQKAEVESLTLGAIDFISKPYPPADVVLARVRRTIELYEDRQIIQYTERDALTGLYTREYFFRYAEQYDLHSRDRDMDAVVLNVNRFHMLNERFGTACGDEVLCRIGGNLRELAVESGGIVCRRGADAFMLYCPHREDYREILERAAEGTAVGEGVNRVHMRMRISPCRCSAASTGPKARPTRSAAAIPAPSAFTTAPCTSGSSITSSLSRTSTRPCARGSLRSGISRNSIFAATFLPSPAPRRWCAGAILPAA